MENKMILDFHLFDGEGGAEAGATASQSDSKQDIKTVQYGKSTGNEQTPSQVGSDKGNENDLNAEWEALTGKGGKFHDMLGQRVSSAIQDRFKNQRDLQGQVDRISEDLSPLFMNYGLKSGDFEGLKNAIANDDAFYQAQAEKAGLDIEQYKANLKLQAEAEKGRQITAAYEEQQRLQALFDTWEADASELQQVFPAFDLGLEMEHNPAFADLLNKGIPVRDAFMLTHLDEILNNSTEYQKRTATQQVVSTIQQRASRPMEGALNHNPAIQRKSDPSSLSNDDIDEINRRVARGEQISF